MKKHLLKTVLLAVALLLGTTSTWAEDVVVPVPVYFCDFNYTNGLTIVGNVGNDVFEDDSDPRFGKIFHNDPELTKSKRTNYLLLPDNVLSHSAETKEMTIGFWVNMKSAADFFFSPLFAAYGAAPVNGVNTWPMFICEARGLIQVNCAGFCDFGINDKSAGTSFNDKTPYVTTAWLDDAVWHYYTVVLTTTTAEVYIDGELKNSWTVDGTSDGQVIAGLFTNGADLKYICLGGNQAWDWGDPDPAFGFDDFGVWNKALSKEQINQIRANKLNRTVTGTQIGKKDNSAGYVSEGNMTEKITLKPGESYNYKFVNYNPGINNWNNYVVPVWNSNGENKIVVRADNWEDKYHPNEKDEWGANVGCTSNFDWTDWAGNMNGATVDMTVSFTKDKNFKMDAKITAVNGSEWTYSYTNDFEGAADKGVSLTESDYIKVALAVSNAWLDVTSEGYSLVSKTMTDAGWATYCSANALDLTGEIANLTDAYIITGGNNTTKYVYKESVKGQIVPANVGLLLEGTAGEIVFPVADADATTDAAGNALVGVTAEKTLDAEAGYVLVKENEVVAFYKNLNPFTLNANTAYLPANFAASSSEAPRFYALGGETTGIDNLNVDAEASKAEGTIYNLAGQRVSKDYKGLVILNGKKVIIK